MDRWLEGSNVLDDIDELEDLYRNAPVAVHNEEPPPRIHIQEDVKLETQYSEGSGDECEDDSTGPSFAAITEQLRQVASVNWATYNFEDTKNDVVEEEEEEDEEVVLTKSSGLNPEVIEFVPRHVKKENNTKIPKYIKGQIDLLKKAMKDTISQNKLNPKDDTGNGGLPEQEIEQVKCDNQSEPQENKTNNIENELKQPEQPQPSKLPKPRNMAITSLLRLKALETETLKNRRSLLSTNTLLKPDDFLTPPTASVASPVVALLPYNAAAEKELSPPPMAQKVLSETNGSPLPSVYKPVIETNGSQLPSVFKTVTETNESPSPTVSKAGTNTNVSSSSSPSISKPANTTKSPPPSARDVFSPKTASPKRTLAKEIPLVIREYLAPEPPPKVEPAPTPKPKKTKKCTEFVSTAKAASYYDKYNTIKMEMEREKAAEQTKITLKDNTINALIEVKLKEYKQDEGRAEAASCKINS